MKIVTIKLRLTYLLLFSLSSRLYRIYTSFNLSDLFIYLLEETSNVFKKTFTRVYINIFQKLRVLRDKFDRQNNYTRVPHFPVIIPDDFPHIFFFPVLSSLKIIAIRYELSTRVDRRGKERRGNGRWEGKGKARRTMNARLCISTSTSMARIMHLTVSIGSRFLPFISFYIVLLVSSTDTSTFTYPRGRV